LAAIRASHRALRFGRDLALGKQAVLELLAVWS
jgi:hypothetical protein